MGRRGKDEPPDVTANPALDQLERWTKACQVWNECKDCPHQNVCHRVGDMLINHLSDPHTRIRIRIACSTTIP